MTPNEFCKVNLGLTDSFVLQFQASLQQIARGAEIDKRLSSREANGPLANSSRPEEYKFVNGSAS